MSKRIHIIGICGVATSALGIAFKTAGWKVTGSDKGFFPPISDHLKNYGIQLYAGWHPEKMIKDGVPDMVMIGGSGKSSQNPETVFAREKKIPIYSYPEIIEKYFLREHSIVCAGTWGKTTTSALLSFILEKAGWNPTYMFGALSLSQNQSAKITGGKWTVLEGDEYTGSQTDNTAKFFHYHPTHLLMTSISWDHADIYPTEETYFDVFRKLIRSMKKGGLIVASSDDTGIRNILKNRQDGKLVYYGKNDSSEYQYENISCTKEGIAFTIKHGIKKYIIKSGLLGEYNAENITGVFALSCEIGILPENIIASIAEFKGIKRRLEKRYDGNITVIDDIAHSPEKARTTLKELRLVTTGRIFAIFEPNIGGRERANMKKYENAFKDAHEVIIPRLSPLKSKKDGGSPMEGDELTDVIAKTKNSVFYMPDDDKIVEHLKERVKPDDCIVFLGSHGFRGMIEEVVKIFVKNP